MSRGEGGVAMRDRPSGAAPHPFFTAAAGAALIIARDRVGDEQGRYGEDDRDDEELTERERDGHEDR